jgi:hypothetical protein
VRKLREAGVKLGPTGRYPHGSLGWYDKGEVRAAISRNERGDVHIDFGTNLSWVCLPPDQAIKLARIIAEKAGAKRIEIDL